MTVLEVLGLKRHFSKCPQWTSIFISDALCRLCNTHGSPRTAEMKTYDGKGVLGSGNLCISGHSSILTSRKCPYADAATLDAIIHVSRSRDPGNIRIN